MTFGEASYRDPDMNAQGNLVMSRMRSQSDVWKFPITGEPSDNAKRGRPNHTPDRRSPDSDTQSR